MLFLSVSCRNHFIINTVSYNVAEPDIWVGSGSNFMIKKRDMKAGTFFWLNKSLNEAFGAYDEQNIKLDTGTR